MGQGLEMVTIWGRIWIRLGEQKPSFCCCWREAEEGASPRKQGPEPRCPELLLARRFLSHAGDRGAGPGLGRGKRERRGPPEGCPEEAGPPRAEDEDRGNHRPCDLLVGDVQSARGYGSERCEAEHVARGPQFARRGRRPGQEVQQGKQRRYRGYARHQGSRGTFR